MDINDTFGFKTLMLFRCLKRERAEQFCRGDIYFGSPRQWIEIEKNGNKGQGDILEGVFFSTFDNDNTDFVRYLKLCDRFDFFTQNGTIFFRNKEVLDTRCLCLYGLHDNVFVKEKDSEGRVHFRTRITNKYFKSFSNIKTRDEYKLVDSNEQPVVILINNPFEFFRRIVDSLKEIGVSDSEIIISPVTYTERNRPLLNTKTPFELLLKDISFKDQSEVRIIVNCKKQKYLDYMRTHNNTISIGAINDITEIYDYYFEDMELERWKNNGMLISLPEQKVVDLDDMNFFELLDLFQNIRLGLIQTPNCIENEAGQEKLGFLIKLFQEKYGVVVSVDKNKKVDIQNLSNELFEQLKVHYSIQIRQSEFIQSIDLFIKNGNVLEAKRKCEQLCDDKEMQSVAYFCLGKVYAVLCEFDSAIKAYKASLSLDFNRVESLNGIAEICYIQGKYDDAINYYEQIQDEKGYESTIWNNIGICYINLGKYDLAIENFDKAISMDSSSAMAYYNRGVAYLRQNMLDIAKADYLKAIELDSNNSFYRNEFNKYF